MSDGYREFIMCTTSFIKQNSKDISKGFSKILHLKRDTEAF